MPKTLAQADCDICGYGLIEFTSEDDSELKWTHDRTTPIEERHHLPQPVNW